MQTLFRFNDRFLVPPRKRLESMLKTSLLAFCLAMPVAAATATVPITASFAPVSSLSSEAKFKTISIKAADNTVIKATYWAPKSSQRAPAALLVHDAGANREQLAQLAERLHKSGFAVLVPDLRGHGDTLDKPENDFTKLKSDDDKAKAWAFATRDVEASARWMRTNKGIHSANLNLFGFGAGSALALSQAAKDENTRSVTLISPRKKMLGFDLVDDLFDLEGVPTFLIASKEGRKEIEAMAKSIHDEISSDPFIKLVNLKAKKAEDALADRKLGSAITKPLKAIAFPSRSGR